MSNSLQGGIAQIPTLYKGYQFRSLLEARWAVFFDAIGQRWEYEPERFEVCGGKTYLPDFALIGEDGEIWAYAEVKSRTKDEVDIGFRNLHELLLKVGRKSPIAYLLCGIPGEIFIFASVMTVAKTGPIWIFRQSLDDAFSGADEGIKAARSARFEHGESGRT